MSYYDEIDYVLAMHDAEGRASKVKSYKYKPTPRDSKCSKCYITMVQIKDLVKGWQWVCLKCGLTHDIPETKLVLGESEKC